MLLQYSSSILLFCVRTVLMDQSTYQSIHPSTNQPINTINQWINRTDQTVTQDGEGGGGLRERSQGQRSQGAEDARRWEGLLRHQEAGGGITCKHATSRTPVFSCASRHLLALLYILVLVQGRSVKGSSRRRPVFWGASRPLLVLLY